MKPLAAYATAGSVRLVETNASVRQNGATHVVRLGDEIRIDSKLLEEYCFSASSDLAHDLMSVIGVVAYADRAIKRHHSEGWVRKIDVEIAVLDKTLWSSREVTEALEECLDYLTSDSWHFSFRSRKQRPQPLGQSPIRLSPGHPHVFLPYSHGLDSYAQLRLLQAREPESEFVCVFTDSRSSAKTWREFCRRTWRGDVRDIPIPFNITKQHHSEPSYRSRPFIFYLLAAYGALLAGSGRVVIPENGQGSWGGVLAPLGSEGPHRSCHPGFTHRLRRLLECLTGRSDVAFEHPALFQTKGQVLSQLAAIEADTKRWVDEHWSCSYDQRHANLDGARVHCGVCGNCLLRRVSALSSGIVDTTTYKFSDLTAERLEDAAIADDQPPREMKAFLDLAGNSCRSMQRLADLANDSQNTAIWTEAAALARDRSEDTKAIHGLLMTLLLQHATEWREFLAACGERSWIQEMARG